MDNNLTIQRMIEEYAEKAPHHVAIIDERLSYSYNELNQLANKLAHYLQKFELEPDTLIAISIDRSPQLLIGILGILKAGCAYLPLDQNHSANHLKDLLKDSRTPVLITQSKSREKFSDFSGHIILIDQDWHEINFQSSHNPSYPSNPENLAYVIYTSGSTGKSKGVLIENKSIVNYTQWFGSYSACRPQDRVDFSSHIIFDMAGTTTVTALALGLQVVICRDEVKKDIPQYLLHLNKNKINIIKLTPTYFDILAQQANNHAIKLPHLQSIILGGEILYAKDCIAWLKMYPKHVLFNEYGPTETTVAVTQYKVTTENISKLGVIVPIGKPGFNMDCKLYNDGKQEMSLGKTGELYVRGMCLARGYLNQEELTSQQFIHDPFHPESHAKLYKTGDLCRYLPDGNIEFIKRIDDQVKIRGYRIEPAEIEMCLESHPLIKESSVVARENPSQEKQLIAYYVPKDENQLPSHHELREYLHQKLADYMIPSLFVMLKAFPITSSGKRDKKAFPVPEVEEQIVAPRTQLERQLINIWQKIFHLKKIGVESHFFELGGHSLLAERLLMEIEKSLGKEIHLEDLYKAPTIRQLAPIIAAAAASSHSCDVFAGSRAALDNKGVIPLANFQFVFWIANLFEPKIQKMNIVARRRLSGRLDSEVMTFALQQVLERHEVLSYQVGKFFPVQYLKKNIRFNIIEEDLTNYSEMEAELELSVSLNKLIGHKTWQKNLPLIVVKLFHLNNAKSELQICVPHIVFDDISEEILFSELSTAYLHYKNDSRSIPLDRYAQFKDYVSYERDHSNQDLERDMVFWKQYLHDTALFTFPETEIIRNMKNIPYSTYMELPSDVMENIHQICAHSSISITDLLSAAIALALNKEVGYLNNKILINIVRSIRENEVHDKMIGCFLRIDPIKIDVKAHLNLIELAKSIQQSRVDTEPYQACSGMIKIACMDKSKKFIRNFVMHIFSTIYCALFRKLKLNPKMLTMYGLLNTVRGRNQFVININLLNNFLSPKYDKTLFGFKLERTKIHTHDILNVNNVLDICLFKDENLEKAYLAISGNLKASFRQLIGDEIVFALAPNFDSNH